MVTESMVYEYNGMVVIFILWFRFVSILTIFYKQPCITLLLKNMLKII